MRMRQLNKMAVRRLPASLHPCGESGDILIVVDKSNRQTGRVFQLWKQSPRIIDIQSIGCSLSKNPHKSKFCNRAGCKRRELTSLYPGHHAVVERMVDNSKSDQSIHVQKILGQRIHGKSARISATSSLVSTGASGPASKTGNPVTGSATIFATCTVFFGRVSTMRPAPPSRSMLASSRSPARIPSFRRSGPGRTIWPLVETRVCMVRQSYPGFPCGAIAANRLHSIR